MRTDFGVNDFARFLQNALEGVYYDGPSIYSMLVEMPMRFLLRLYSL